MGEKSNIPVRGKAFLIGINIGSVIAYTTLKILFKTLLLPTGIHDNITRANIAKYKISTKILKKLLKNVEINITPLVQLPFRKPS